MHWCAMNLMVDKDAWERPVRGVKFNYFPIRHGVSYIRAANATLQHFSQCMFLPLNFSAGACVSQAAGQCEPRTDFPVFLLCPVHV